MMFFPPTSNLLSIAWEKQKNTQIDIYDEESAEESKNKVTHYLLNKCQSLWKIYRSISEYKHHVRHTIFQYFLIYSMCGGDL